MELFTGEVAFQNDSIVSMLARIEAICGPFPRHMITAGRQISRYFSAASGLLYEGLDEDTIDIFQPKRTTVAQRLGFEDKISHEEELLADFCRNLLTVDPQARPTAADALSHPWIISGESLTEVDVKYPTS
jgi:serine/threonine protein kinase